MFYKGVYHTGYTCAWFTEPCSASKCSVCAKDSSNLKKLMMQLSPLVRKVKYTQQGQDYFSSKLSNACIKETFKLP